MVIPALINKYVETNTVLKEGVRTEPIPTPFIMAPTPRLIIVPQLMVPPKAATPELPYAIPSLSADLASVDTHPAAIAESIDPASKIAPAYIVGAVNQPVFETFVGKFVNTDTMGAVYHVHEGFAHAESPAFIEAVPTAQPYAVPVITPKMLPSVAPILPPQGAHVHPSFGADTNELTMPTPVAAQVQDIYAHHTHTGNSIIDSLINHMHEGQSVLDAAKNVFREVAMGQHQGYQHFDYRNMYDILAQHVSMHQDRTQHVSLTMNDFRDAFNRGFEAVRQEPGYAPFTRTMFACHDFLNQR